MAEDAYSLLAEPIQRVLWQLGLEALRPIQVESIHKIIGGDRDIIISARTASGKTEAAFLPILSRIYENPKPSIQAMYVGPLKALINDQFRRLEDLCTKAEIPVHRWHGDVGENRKKQLIEDPSGVLLITPESIESLFINRSAAINRIFSELSFVVIDELHSLVGRERGTHLRSLLYRLRHRTQRDFRIIGLSATIGEFFETYARWVKHDQPSQVDLITDPGEKKEVRFKVYAYVAPADLKSDDDEAQKSGELPPKMMDEMFSHMAGKKNLIFANAKQDVEWCADSLNEKCKQTGRPEEFLVHHGSLSKEIREFAETEMQNRSALSDS